MRILALIVVAAGLGRTARADDEIVLPRHETGLLFEFRDIDLGLVDISAPGVAGRAVLGHCRFGLLAEVGLGATFAPGQSMGEYGLARVGSRILLARSAESEAAVDLILDVGVGENLYRIGEVATQPEAFLGWGTLIHGDHHALELDFRVAIAPTVGELSTAICRGSCAATSASVGATFSALLGLMSW